MAGKRSGKRTYLSAEDRRSEIVEAAFKCLQTYGYAKLTARKIAESSGFSLGHITYNFKDMNEVLVETYRLASKKLLEATKENLLSAAKEPTEQLRVFLRAGFTPDFLRMDYIRVRVDLWSASLAQQEIAETERALYDRYRQHLIDILDAVAADRGHGGDRIQMLADSIMATLDGLWLDWERRQDEVAVDHGLDACLMLVDLLLPKPPLT